MPILSNPWSPSEDALLINLCSAGKHTLKEIGQHFFSRKRYAHHVRMRHLGIGNTFRRPPKYTYNTAYFDKVTLENCYWAGMLQTDGCISLRGDYVSIIWGCAEKDRQHMERFKSAVQSTHPIHQLLKKCQLSISDKEKIHPYCRLTFEGAFQWATALKRHFGFDQNKTLRTVPPNLPTHLHKLAFLKGLIDGDGCITHDNTKGGLHMSICGANKELLLWCKGTVDSMNLPSLAHRDTSVNQREGEKCYYWTLGGLTAALLHQILYRLPTPHLARKYESPKVLAIIDYWKTRPEWPSETFFSNILNSTS